MSLRGAINAFCKHCLYSPDEPGRWKEQITACTSLTCPLYPVRPVTGRPRDNRGKSVSKVANLTPSAEAT